MRRIRIAHVAVLLGFAVVATVCAAVVLISERAPVPFRDTYQLRFELETANGISSGIGQPVTVVGVKVGTITGVTQRDGRALVTAKIERGKLPRTYSNATATVVPISPLSDLELALTPGRPPGHALRDDAVVPIERTRVPTPLSQLLARLDSDTRAWMTSLIAAMGEGTAGRGSDMRKLATALGPTVHVTRSVTMALRERRKDLAVLVHDLSRVMRAAAGDEDLRELVTAGSRAMAGLSKADVPLRASLHQMAPTLSRAQQTLGTVEPFAKQLTRTLDELDPAVRRLPATLRSLQAFSRVAGREIHDSVRPFVRGAQPVARHAGPIVQRLGALVPQLTSSFQTFHYTANELAYNPPGDDEGMLFWMAWAAHNWNSFLYTGDAHGRFGRALLMMPCVSLRNMGPLGDLFSAAIGALRVCPGS